MWGRLLAGSCLLALLVAPAAEAKKRPRLIAFVSCPQLVRYASAHAQAATPLPTATTTPTVAPTAAPQSSAGDGGTSEKTAATDDVSQTNVQEAGIDEPDVVKTDGRTLFVVSGTTLYAVDARSATPQILGSVALPGSGYELLLHGGHALVVGQEAFRGIVPLPIMDGPMPSSRIAYQPPRTILASVDVRDPAHMTVGPTVTVDGSSVTARA